MARKDAQLTDLLRIFSERFIEDRCIQIASSLTFTTLLGLGYWLASGNPFRHWPIVVVGTLAKLLGAAAFARAHAVLHAMPMRPAFVLVAGDMIWWLPFLRMVLGAWRWHEGQRRLWLRHETDRTPHMPLAEEAMQTWRMRDGRTLAQASDQGPVLLVFLRHFGCTFCRETLGDLSEQRESLERDGAQLCLVHMTEDRRASEFFTRFGLSGLPRVSDPARELYNAFELGQGSIGQVMGARLWVRAVVAAIRNRRWIFSRAGDPFQMPGVFILHRGKVLRAFRHADAADRPEYAELLRGALPAPPQRDKLSGGVFRVDAASRQASA